MSFTIRSATLIGVLAMLLLTTTCFFTVSVKAQNEVAWVYDYPTGMKTATEKNKPVLIYIHEQWCPRCKNMDQNTWNNTEVVALSSSFININVLGTEQGRLYNYSKPPLVVLTDPQGRVLEKYNAELSASEVTALQRKVLAEAPFASPFPTASPSNTPAPTSNVPTASPSNSAKAAVTPGFDTILSVVGIMVAVGLTLVFQRFR
jgi:Thioredoxin-like